MRRAGDETRGPERLRAERRLSWALLGLTAVASVALGADVLGGLLRRLRAGDAGGVAEQAVFAGIVAVVLYGNLVHQVTRLGLLARRARHEPIPREALERAAAEEEPPALAVLVPSYREEPRVIRQTLLSAALQDHPRRRVVLLVDDPPRPGDAEGRRALEAARAMPGAVRELLEKPAERFAGALRDFRDRRASGALDLAWETRELAQLHAEAAAWLEAQAANEAQEPHDARRFVETTFRRPALVHRARMRELEGALADGALPDPERILREQRRLARRFDAGVVSFERKRYANLSHEPNKAMNLNAYLGLLGGRFREERRADGLHLVPAREAEAGLRVPDADFVVTLDADSLLAHDYALRLVEIMRRPGNERLAVAQTPYSAFPGAPATLERVAGATTDVQYRIHQGFTRHGATFWVGANALIRTAALRDLRTTRRERGFEVAVFIQDGTVIEDTESSVDLIARGWTLHNHPERLAWSATPPDFGALLVQRRRWANGGLLILPKLLRTLLAGPGRLRRLPEGWLRAHYLVSIAGVNVALLLLLLFPFEQALRTAWFPVAALPYFLLYGRDLGAVGYPLGDLARAYALNLVLLPVNLGGVAKSLQQAATGRKLPFARTPKVSGRTAAPPFYVLAELGLLAALVLVLGADLRAGHWIHASFVAANGALLAYGLVHLVGLRAMAEDLRAGLRPTSAPRLQPRRA